MAENPNNKRLPGGIDEGVDPAVISREWIEQIINSRIQRRIDDVRIKPISLSRAKAGRVVYVIHIPQSLRAPHMADDKRFYKRYNFQSFAMEEYEVRDVARRLDVPDLSLSVRLESEPYVLLRYSQSNYSDAFAVLASVTNESPMPAEYHSAWIYLDSRIRITQNPRSAGVYQDQILRIGGRQQTTTGIQLNMAAPRHMPIWKGVRFSIFEPQLRIALPNEAGDFIIGWTIDSPRTEQKNRFSCLRSDLNRVQIERG